MASANVKVLAGIWISGVRAKEREGEERRYIMARGTTNVASGFSSRLVRIRRGNDEGTGGGGVQV